MFKKGLVLTIAALIAFSLVGCDKLTPKPKPTANTTEPPAIEGTVVATIGSGSTQVVVTLEGLDDEINEYNAFVIGQGRPELKITTAEKKVEYLKNEVIRRVLFYLAGVDSGLAREASVRREVERRKQEIVMRKFLEQEASSIEATSAKVTEYYEKYKDMDPQLKEPEERRIREIGVASEAAAKEIMVQIYQGGDFGAIARQSSTLPSAAQGGDLGYIKIGDIKSPEYAKEAFSPSLNIGKNSNYFRGSDGIYYILKLEDKKGGKYRQLSEVEEYIRGMIKLLDFQEKIKDLYENFSTKYNQKILESEVK